MKYNSSLYYRNAGDEEEIDFGLEIDEDDDIYGAPGGFPLDGEEDDPYADDLEGNPDVEKFEKPEDEESE